MKTRKTFKVILLPTEKSNKVGDIVLNTALKVENNQVRLAQLNVLTVDSRQPSENQHLYILSDDEIKEGDWCVDIEVDKVFQARWDNPHNYKKIVATTDTSLKIRNLIFGGPDWVENGLLPQLPESFIQAYIKAYNEDKPITEVDLEYQNDWKESTKLYMKAFGDNPNDFKYEAQIKTRPDNTVIVHQSKMYTREEVKQVLIAFYRQYNNIMENKQHLSYDELDKFTISWLKENL